MVRSNKQKQFLYCQGFCNYVYKIIFLIPSIILNILCNKHDYDKCEKICMYFHIIVLRKEIIKNLLHRDLGLSTSK